MVRQPDVGDVLRSARGAGAAEGVVTLGVADADAVADSAANTTGWRLAGTSEASDMSASLYPYSALRKQAIEHDAEGLVCLI